MKIIYFYNFFAQVISLTAGNMVPSLTRAMDRTTNLKIAVTTLEFLNRLWGKKIYGGTLSNQTHQGSMEMCWILQDVGILRFYFSKQKYFGTMNFCWMSQDVGKLRCRIAQIPLYSIFVELCMIENCFPTLKGNNSCFA